MTLTFLLAMPAFAGEPSPADRETARGLLQDGDKAMASGDTKAALKAYEGAHALLGLPATAMAVVKAHVALGQLVEARDVALSVGKIPKVAGEKPANVAARKEAEKVAEDLATRIPSLQVEVSPSSATATVEVDGAALPPAAATAARKLNPGKHTVRVTASGMKAFESTVDLKERDAQRLTASLEPAGAGDTTSASLGVTSNPKPGESGSATPNSNLAGPRKVEPPPPSDGDGGGVSPLVPVGFSIAGAGLITGVVAGVVSMTQVSSAKDDHGCTDVCPASERAALEADLDPARTTAWVSDIGFIVAGAGAALGVVGLVVTLTDSGAPETGKVGNTLRLRATGTGLSLEGTL
jgi:hypothetical protein